ncbi:acyl-CoA wax alcohol acyltransferase 2 [Phocoena sinus]|uniref:acyl-CoA wax alcohol acyltransferase 2 n=1 Tax=Phocoena sinus TaxID=42100 RepID=UPI0013C44F26|nr:acyl-CoA wax alcohol acyltransferase 2 [Phocoena sinus]
MLLPSKKDLKTALEVFALFQWALSALVIDSPAETGLLLCAYPLQRLKTHDLSPSLNYILACHPHGLMSHSCFGHFATEKSGFSKIFPGITPYILTLEAFFWVPFLREYVMSTGACSVSQSSVDFLLTRRGTGNTLIVVVSGLAECRYSLPGSTTLVLKDRTSFVRTALRHGQNSYIKQIFTPGGFVNRFQKWFQSMVYIYPCAFYGHGFLENSWGLLPYARPVTTTGELALVLAASSGTQDPVPRLDLGSGHVQRQVTGQDERRVGKPLPLPKIENLSKETVVKYHVFYIDALHKLASTRPSLASQRPRSWC